MLLFKVYSTHKNHILKTSVAGLHFGMTSHKARGTCKTNILNSTLMPNMSLTYDFDKQLNRLIKRLPCHWPQSRESLFTCL